MSSNTYSIVPSVLHYLNRRINRLPQHIRETLIGTRSSLQHPHVMIMSTTEDGLAKKIVRNRLNHESYLQPYEYDSVLPLYNIRITKVTLSNGHKE